MVVTPSCIMRTITTLRTPSMTSTLTVRGDIRWETIDTASARRLGLETRTLTEPGRGQGRVRTRVVKVEDLWVEVALDEHWRACYRFVVADDGTLEIGELRLLPQEGDHPRPGTSAGTWQGIHGRPPTKRLTSRHVHALRVALHAQEIDQLLAQLQADRRIPRTVSRRWNVGTPKPSATTASSSPTKRRKYSDLDYARVARDYHRLCKQKRGRPITALATKRGISPTKARGLVARARAAKMLSEGHKGQYGGVLTDQAKQLLASARQKPRNKTR